jgi:hypothetical protein
MTIPHAKKALVLAKNVKDDSVESYAALKVFVYEAQPELKSKEKSRKKDRKKEKDDDDDDDANEDFPPIDGEDEVDDGVLQTRKTKKRAATATEFINAPTDAFLKLPKKQLKKQFPKAEADVRITASNLRSEYTRNRDRFFEEFKEGNKNTATAAIFLRDLLTTLCKIHGKYEVAAAIKEEDTSALNTEAMVEFELKLAKQKKSKLAMDSKEPETRAPGGNQGGNRRGGRSSKRCFFCNKVGHLQGDCWQSYGNNGGQGLGGGRGGGRGFDRGFGRGFGRGGGRGGGRGFNGYFNNYYQQQQQLPFSNPPANTQQQPGTQGRGNPQYG